MKTHLSLKNVLIFFGAAIGYLLLGIAGDALTTISELASPIWPAAGFAIGLSFLYGPIVIPGIFLGAFLLRSTFPSENLLIPFFVALGVIIEALFGGWVMRRFLEKRIFKDYSDLFAVIISGVVGAFLSASTSTLAMLGTGDLLSSDFMKEWFIWWSGDLIGIIMILPLFIEIKNKNFKTTKRQLLETFLILAGSITLLYFSFTKGYSQAFIWLTGPALILVGARAGRLYASILLLIVSLFAATLTVMGYGPCQYGNTERNLFYVQTLIAGFSLSVLFIRQMRLEYKTHNRYILGIITAAAILFIVTYSITYYTKRSALNDYKRSTEAATNSIDKITNLYDMALKGSSGAFSMSKDVTREEWKTYVTSSKITTYLPEGSGIGFIADIKKDRIESFAKDHNLELKFIDEKYSAQFHNRYIITYLEGGRDFLHSEGLDIGSEQKRRIAAEKAKEYNKSYSTGPIIPFLYYQDKKAFSVYHPTLSHEGHFIGWTFIPVIYEYFFGSHLSQYTDQMNIRIFADNEMTYNSSKDPKAFKANDFFSQRKINIFGVPHLIQFYPTDLFFSRHTEYAYSIPFVMYLLVLIIAALIMEQMTFSIRAEELVKKRTKELEASKMQLIESSKMASLGEMASSMAHEINNPLTIIQGKISVIGMILNDLQVHDPMLTSELDKIKSTTDRIEKIVKGLRNFSRTSAHDPFEYTSLKQIMTETLDLCAQKIKAEGISLNVQEIPAVTIRCRPSQVSQVLINLLNNSRDAILNSSEKWIDINFETEKNKIIIMITDSGPGISPSIAEKMMEPFFTTKEVGKGTGLGLSISKGIVASHDGKLWLDHSHPHTRFVIELKHYS